MSTITKTLSAGLMALAMGGTAVTLGGAPALAKGGGGGHGNHGNGSGSHHHGGDHRHRWDYGYAPGPSYYEAAPSPSSRCFPKRYVGDDGEVLVRKVCR
jgi:hypothetical protein